MKSVLIVGDGNFSFSLSVGKLQEKGDLGLIQELLQMKGPFEFLCTSFDERAQLVTKYPECEKILPSLEKLGRVGVKVQHGINAWELEEHYPGKVFDAVVWNHPHLGTENFNLHRFLLCHFMDSAQKVLSPDGVISISVLEGQSIRWEVVKQGEKVGLNLAQHSTFHPSRYPGYETRRNRTGGSFQNSHTQDHHEDALPSVSILFSKSDKPRPVVEAEPLVIPKKAIEFKFFCDVCGKGFKKKQGVDTHHKQVHVYKKYGADWSVEGKKLKCGSCDREFHDEEARWQHKVASHLGDTNIPHPSREGDETVQESGGYGYFPCEVCGMSVSRHPDWGMTAHLESLKPIVGLELPCGVSSCTKLFIEQRALRQHRNFCRIKAKEEDEKEKAKQAQPTILPYLGAGVLAAYLGFRLWRK